LIRHIKHHLMGRSRERKFKQFLSLTKPSKDSTILDVGVADREYSPFDNYFEKKYPYPHKITALSISPLKEFPGRYPGVRTVAYRGDKFPFKDNEFSIVVSNAVVEHVGGAKAVTLYQRNEESRATVLLCDASQRISRRIAYQLSFHTLASQENF